MAGGRVVVAGQLGWLECAGLWPSRAWTHRDLAVLVGYAAEAARAAT